MSWDYVRQKKSLHDNFRAFYILYVYLRDLLCAYDTGIFQLPSDVLCGLSRHTASRPHDIHRIPLAERFFCDEHLPCNRVAVRDPGSCVFIQHEADDCHHGDRS